MANTGNHRAATGHHTTCGLVRTQLEQLERSSWDHQEDSRRVGTWGHLVAAKDLAAGAQKDCFLRWGHTKGELRKESTLG